MAFVDDLEQLLARAVPLDLDGEHGDIAPLQQLDDIASQARFAYLVEMDHCIEERHAFRLLCMRYLASHGWRWFGEEMDWRWTDRVQRYLETGDEGVLEPLDDGNCYTSGLLADQTKGAPHHAIHAGRRRAAQALRRAIPDARYFAFDSGGGDPEYIEIANAIESLDDALEFMAYREKLMHERVARIANEQPEARIALMGGSTHLAKDDTTLSAPGLMPVGGARVASIGHFAAHNLTDRPVLAIWLLHGGGHTASPYIPPPGELVVGPDTINAALRARWDRPCFLRVSDDTVPRTIAGMNNLTMSCRFADQVDAIVFCPTVTPVRI